MQGSGIEVRKDGGDPVGSERNCLNLKQGTNVTLTITDNPGTNCLDVEIAASGGGGGTPSDTVVNETSFGQSPVAGASANYSRGDHTHGTPTNPVPAHASATTDVHGFDASGNSPAQTHGNTRHTADFLLASEKAAASGVASLTAGSQLVQAVQDAAIGDAKLRNSGACSVIGRSANSVGAPADIAAGSDDQYLRRSAGVLGFGALPASGGGPRAITFVVGDGLNIITTGAQGVFPQVPFSGTITRWTIVADVSGSIVLDVWKTTYAGAPPTDANTITGTEKPTLGGAQKNEDTTLTTWTTAVVAGDVLGFEVESAATVKRATLTIWVTPT